jgi:hypothetical protein
MDTVPSLRPVQRPCALVDQGLARTSEPKAEKDIRMTTQHDGLASSVLGHAELVPTQAASISGRGIATLVAIGAVTATLGDANHVRTGAIAYPQPWLFGQAWWVFPGFVLTFVTMVFSYLVLSSFLVGTVSVRDSRAPGNASAFIASLSAFMAAYLASGFAASHPALLAGLFFVTFLVRWIVTYERAWLLFLAVLMALGGMIGEGTLAVAGLAKYAHADVFHVPLWLGGLYMHGAFALRDGMRCLVYAATTARDS